MTKKLVITVEIPTETELEVGSVGKLLDLRDQEWIDIKEGETCSICGIKYPHRHLKLVSLTDLSSEAERERFETICNELASSLESEFGIDNYEINWEVK